MYVYVVFKVKVSRGITHCPQRDSNLCPAHQRTGRATKTPPPPPQQLRLYSKRKRGIFWIFFHFMYDIQHCVICCPTNSTVSEDAGIEPRTVATTALAVRRCNRNRLDLIHNSTRSNPHSVRSHPHSARSHPHSARYHPHSARSHPCNQRETWGMAPFDGLTITVSHSQLN